MNLEPYRTELFQLAYGMLGSVATAEDIVQEAWFRLERAESIRNPRAFLRTTVSRLALDELRSAHARRVCYAGPWLPEPLPMDDDATADPEAHLALAEALSMATLVVLEQLTPAERAAFLLREVFDTEYAEVARLLGRSETASRQLVRRARQHLSAHRPRFDTYRAAHQSLLDAFVHASTTGDLAGLKALLTDDVQLTSDGGGKVVAARKPILGRDRVARFFIGICRKRPDVRFAPRPLSQQPGVWMAAPDEPPTAIIFAIADGQITAIYAVRNPQKLAHLVPDDEDHGPTPT
ncbi:MAG: RNA polymerase sigma factor SigJ [Myxococcota bacterium]